MRLNVGCGDRRIPGWTGVDITQRAGTDIVADACSIPLPDQCADEIMAIHLLEHLYEWEAPQALREWHRLLKVGGKLTLEMPDLMKAARNLAEGYVRPGRHPDQQTVWPIYGDPRAEDPLMMHKAGWWFDRLRPVLEDVGFSRVTEHTTQFHGVGRERRDFRVEAIRA